MLSCQELVKTYPIHDDAVLQYPTFTDMLSSFINLLVPHLQKLVDALAELVVIAECVYRMSGGLLGALTDGGVSIDVERPDPRGGSRPVTVREQLSIGTCAAVLASICLHAEVTPDSIVGAD